jgi:hypothetical protein
MNTKILQQFEKGLFSVIIINLIKTFIVNPQSIHLVTFCGFNFLVEGRFHSHPNVCFIKFHETLVYKAPSTGGLFNIDKETI